MKTRAETSLWSLAQGPLGPQEYTRTIVIHRETRDPRDSRDPRDIDIHVVPVPGTKEIYSNDCDP